MSDLIAKIQRAQVRAGEEAVLNNLREKGLLEEDEYKAQEVQRSTSDVLAESLHHLGILLKRLTIEDLNDVRIRAAWQFWQDYKH